jgi:hypothetical protein
MKGWAWYEDPTFHVPHGDSIIDGAFLDGHIRSAIDDALRHKGYEKVNQPRGRGAALPLPAARGVLSPPVIPRSLATRDPFLSHTEAPKGSLAALGMTIKSEPRTAS